MPKNAHGTTFRYRYLGCRCPECLEAGRKKYSKAGQLERTAARMREANKRFVRIREGIRIARQRQRASAEAETGPSSIGGGLVVSDSQKALTIRPSASQVPR